MYLGDVGLEIVLKWIGDKCLSYSLGHSFHRSTDLFLSSNVKTVNVELYEVNQKTENIEATLVYNAEKHYLSLEKQF